MRSGGPATNRYRKSRDGRTTTRPYKFCTGIRKPRIGCNPSKSVRPSHADRSYSAATVCPTDAIQSRYAPAAPSRRATASILMLLPGWLLGLLSPAIAERIRRGYRVKELTASIVDELVEFQHTMAVVSWSIRARYAETSDEFIDRILPIFDAYQGGNREERFTASIKRLWALPEAARAEAQRTFHAQSPTHTINIPQYSLPLLVAQISDFSICPFPFQRAILHVRYRLDLFNQPIPYLRSLFDKTFTELSNLNVAAVKANTEMTPKSLARRAEMIVTAIDEVRTMPS
jgi:hypothetical protein